MILNEESNPQHWFLRMKQKIIVDIEIVGPQKENISI